MIDVLFLVGSLIPTKKVGIAANSTFKNSTLNLYMRIPYLIFMLSNNIATGIKTVAEHCYGLTKLIETVEPTEFFTICEKIGELVEIKDKFGFSLKLITDYERFYEYNPNYPEKIISINFIETLGSIELRLMYHVGLRINVSISKNDTYICYVDLDNYNALKTVLNDIAIHIIGQ